MRTVLAYCALGALPLAAAACSSGKPTCGPGTVQVDGICVPGDDPGPCGPGTVLGPNGCTPIVRPSERRSCEGRYGPTSGAEQVLYVDADYSGPTDGSINRPFSDLAEAVAGAPAGAVVAVAGGTYAGDLVLAQPLAIEGLCAAEVVIEGSLVVQNSSGIAVRGVTVSGGRPGIRVTSVPADGADPGFELRYSILRASVGAGVVIDSGDAAILDSEVVQTARVDSTEDGAGSGIVVLDGSRVDIVDSVSEMNDFIGVDIPDAVGDVGAIAGGFRGAGMVSETAPSIVDIRDTHVVGNRQGGVRIGLAGGLLPAVDDPVVTIDQSNVSNNTGTGVVVVARRLRMLGTSLIGNSVDGIDATDSRVTAAANRLSGVVDGGVGINLVQSPAALSGNRVEQFEQGGILVSSADAVTVVGNDVAGNGVVGISFTDISDVTVHENQVTDTQTSVFASGHGVEVLHPGAEPIDFVSIRGNVIRDNTGAGVVVDGADLGDIAGEVYLIQGNDILENSFGGIHTQSSGGGRIQNNRIEGNAGYGVRVLTTASGATVAELAILENTVLNTVESAAQAGDDGDCILVFDSRVDVSDNTVNGCDRAGILLDSSSGQVAGNSILQAIIDIGSQNGFTGSIDPTPTATSEEITTTPL